MVRQEDFFAEKVKCEASETCKIYAGAKVLKTSLGRHVVVGENSYVNQCVIEDYVQINRRNQLDEVEIGTRSFTGVNTKISHARIGKYTSISWNVSSGGGARHPFGRLSTHPFYQLKQFGIVSENEKITFPQTTIGNDVWIGMGVMIMAGVSIGDGAIVGAGSIVTKDIPPYAVAYGAPAVVHKYRFDSKVIEKLLLWKWWDWPERILQDNMELFRQELDKSVMESIRKIYEDMKQQEKMIGNQRK